MNARQLMPTIPSVLAAMAVLMVPGEPAGPDCAGPAASPPPAATAPDPAGAPSDRAQHPADLLDLTNWKLTLPTGEGSDPDEIHQPDLSTFIGTHFRLNDAADGVVFSADVGGVTTSGSEYPRAELREMSAGDEASWSNRSGLHLLCTRQAVTELPTVKPHVVTAQIHDSEDDVVEVRLEDEKLIAEWDDGDGEAVIDPAYQLGTPFDLVIAAAERRVEIYYDGDLAADIPLSGSGWYFKSGSYVQSNPSKGDDADAVGEVVIYSLRVEHSE